MLKIYLDWNCITHSKNGDSLDYIEKLAEDYHNIAIFPFSDAHLRDNLVSRKEHNEDFEKDIEQLTKICKSHYLTYDNNSFFPKCAYPKEVIEKNGDTLELIQTTPWITKETYQYFLEAVKKNLPSHLQEQIKSAKPEEVFAIIDTYTTNITNTDFISFVNKFQPLKNLQSLETQFKSICIALDLFGFQTDKKDKTFQNKDADATHAFMALSCDYFVTNDKRLRNRSIASYKKFKAITKIITPDKLEPILREAKKKASNIDYFKQCIQQFGIGREESDGIHYQCLPYPVLGFFDICFCDFSQERSHTKEAYFIYSFKKSPYVYFTELENLLNIIIQLSNKSMRVCVKKTYCDPILKGMRGVPVTIQIIDEGMTLIFDNDVFKFNNSQNLPMMKVIFNK